MKRITHLLVVFLLAANSFAQGHFVLAFTGNGQNQMNIYVVTATIGEVNLEAGDEIAAFDGSICCGIATLTQPVLISDFNTFASIAASQKDEGLSNGYTSGNVISYKFWDSSKSQEISGLSAEYLDSKTGFTIAAPTFTMNESTLVKLSFAGPVNHAPLANAGSDQSISEGDPVTLNGSASSDPDSDALNFKWTAPAGIILSSDSDVKPTFTAPEVITKTQYNFSLVVNDGKVDSPPDQVMITVLNVDHAPYVKDSIKDISVDKGSPDQIIDLKTVFADDMGDVLSYSVSLNTNQQAVQAKITGTDLTLSFSTENIGISEIAITASSNGKYANSKFKVEIRIISGNELTVENTDVQIYPNPTKSKVQIKFNLIPRSGTCMIIYSFAGNVIYKSLAKNKEETLNLKDFPTGLYFIKIEQKIPKTYKVVLQ